MATYSGATNINGGQAHLGDVNHVHHHHYNGQHGIENFSSLISWLSNLNFASTLRRHCNKRTPSTGTWLIEDDRYRSWRTSDEHGNRFLWCRGNPGSGKTILCSMIIEHMQHDARPDEAVVYCFFDYARRQELAADTVLAELIVQLASKDMTRSQSTVRALYEQAENGRRKPTMRELTLAFHKLSSHLKKLSVVIDALDECEHFIRRQLITALELTTKMHIHLLVFSRPHVQLDVYLGKYPTILAKIEIQAQTKDLQLFLDTRITDSEDLGWIIGNCEITAQQITTEIIDKAGQSFLAAEMRLNAIQYALTSEDLLTALHSSTADLGNLYNETMSRIKSQCNQRSELAINVLGWITQVKRPLNIRELCHAIGLQFSEKDFTWDRAPAPETVISSCCGLLILDQYTEQVRLLHYTLLEYIEEQCIFATDKATTIRVCLKSLSAPELKPLASRWRPKLTRLAAMQMHIVRTLPFTVYAATHWLDHVHPGLEDSDCIIAFLADDGKIRSWLEVLDFHNPRQQKQVLQSYLCLFPSDPSSSNYLGVQLAIGKGWAACATVLINKTDVGDKGLCKMLYNIVDNRSEDVLKRVLGWPYLLKFVNCEGGLILHHAVKIGFSNGVSSLIEYGADVDQKDTNGCTPLHVSLENRNEGLARQLLKYGASTQSADLLGNTALHWASRAIASKQLFRELLNHGSQVNSKNSRGETPLHLAIKYGGSSTVWLDTIMRLLLDHGADVNATTTTDWSILHYSCYFPEVAQPTRLLIGQSHIKVDCQNDDGNTPLMLAAKSGTKDIINLLLRNGASVTILNNHGQSALHLALEADCKTDPRTSLNQEMAPREIILRIMDQGADVNICDNDGNSALHLAIVHSNSTVISKEIVLRTKDVNSIGTNNDSALNLAVLRSLNSRAREDQQYSLEMVEELLGFGANVNLQGKHKKTPLHLVVEGLATSTGARLDDLYVLLDTLLEAYPDANVHDCMGETVLEKLSRPPSTAGRTLDLLRNSGNYFADDDDEYRAKYYCKVECLYRLFGTLIGQRQRVEYTPSRPREKQDGTQCHPRLRFLQESGINLDLSTNHLCPVAGILRPLVTNFFEAIEAADIAFM